MMKVMTRFVDSVLAQPLLGSVDMPPIGFVMSHQANPHENSRGLFVFPFQALSSSTPRFYGTNRYLLGDIGGIVRITFSYRHLFFHMRNSEYSSPRQALSSEVPGLPVRVWRELTSAIVIRKAGPA